MNRYKREQSLSEAVPVQRAAPTGRPRKGRRPDRCRCPSCSGADLEPTVADLRVIHGLTVGAEFARTRAKRWVRLEAEALRGRRAEGMADTCDLARRVAVRLIVTDGDAAVFLGEGRSFLLEGALRSDAEEARAVVAWAVMAALGNLEEQAPRCDNCGDGLPPGRSAPTEGWVSFRRGGRYAWRCAECAAPPKDPS